MKTLIISLLVLFFINISNGLLVLPYNNVPATIAAGDKIGIPISNEKFIISNCAALGKSYLYTENNEVTDYSPVAYFRDATTLEVIINKNLYIYINIKNNLYNLKYIKYSIIKIIINLYLI